MPNLDAILVSPDTSINDCISAVLKNGHRTLLVHEEQRILGTISEGDLLRLMQEGVDVHHAIDKYMRLDFIYIHSIDYSLARNYFLEYGIALLPVVDCNMRLISMLSLSDILA